MNDAISKLKSELEKAKDKMFAEPILGYLIKRCEEDNGLCEDVCQEHKTWEKCFAYIYEQARQMANGQRQCAVRDDVVYEWAEDYYHKDDKTEEEEKTKKDEERKQKIAEIVPKTVLKPAIKGNEQVSEENQEEEPEEPIKVVEIPTAKKSKKDVAGQLDLFALMGM